MDRAYEVPLYRTNAGYEIIDASPFANDILEVRPLDLRERSEPDSGIRWAFMKAAAKASSLPVEDSPFPKGKATSDLENLW